MPKNGKALAVSTYSPHIIPIRIYHWWPGRAWAGPCPIPQNLIDDALARGSRYLTIALFQAPDLRFCVTTANCCPRDVPDRRIGRAIALGRLAKTLESIGYTVQGA